MFEIVGAEVLERLAELQPIAEAIFGRKQRTPNWLSRKLERECVVPELSAIARTHVGSSATIVGYALLGRPPSLEGRARGAGVGVLASARGRGIGRALLEFVCTRARDAGCSAVEFLVEPERVDWYVAQGFTVVEAQLTLAGRGSGGSTDALACGATLASAPFGERALWSWTPEAWARTPVHERAYVQLPGARAWLTREGRAYLLQRLELDDPTQLEPSLSSLREQLADATPLLLYPCPALRGALTGQSMPLTLQEAGFDVVQRSFVLRRSNWCIVPPCG